MVLTQPGGQHASYSGANNWYVNYKSDGFVCNPGQGCGNSTGSVSNNYWRFMYHVDFSALQGKYLRSTLFHVEMPNCTNYGTCSGHYIGVSRGNCMGFNCATDVNAPVHNQWNGQGYDFDVTALYRYLMANNDYGNWQIAWGEEAQNNYYSYKMFAYDKTHVDFTYDTQPPVSTQTSPADGASVVTNQPTLGTSAVTDAEGEPVSYRYTIATSSNGSGAVTNSGWTPSTSWTVPDNVLQDGTTYYWKVETWDGIADVPPLSSGYRSFKVDLRNGKDSTQAFDTVGPVSVDMATGNLTTSAKSHSISALGGNLGVSLDYNSPQRSRQGLVGEYWNDPSGTLTFPSTPAALTRVDSSIYSDWGASSPYSGIISPDNFLTRWTGYFVAPVTGSYTFYSQVDDRCKLWINNNVILDSWSTYCGWKDATPVTLTAGQLVPIKMEYAETTGTATAVLRVRGAVADQIVPTEWLQTGVRPIATPHGLIGRYYTDPGTHTFPTNQDDPDRIFLTRTDTNMNLNWGTGSPVPNGPSDNFLTRWTGYFTAPVGDTYTFGAGADDGVRIIANGNTVVNSWTDHGATPIVYAGSGITLTAGQTIPMTVEYYDHLNGAQMGLYVKRSSLPSAPDTIVDSTWLSPKAQVLPDGWNLGVDADGDLGYDFAVIGQTSVVLRDSTGETHEYKFANGGFTPPVNEDGHMVRNGDASITLQDSDGRTYVFNSDGTLKLSSAPVDDRQPAALQYTYSGSPAHLAQITDAVNTGRWAKVLYSGDASCPSVPSGFSAVPANMICAVTTSDGQVTQFAYSAEGRLARLIHPGTEITDYGYDTLGRIISLRDSLANDAIMAGQRLSTDTTIQSDIAYDALGRASSVTMPAATTGATRQAHSYDYQLGNTSAHIAGATEPNGFSRKVAYDATYRTTSDTDVANLPTNTEWHATKDLVLSTTDPASLKATTLYDEDDRPTDQYGPAPSSWFNATTRIPLTTPTDYTPQVPPRPATTRASSA